MAESHVHRTNQALFFSGSGIVIRRLQVGAVAAVLEASQQDGRPPSVIVEGTRKVSDTTSLMRPQIRF
jgi:hypothetical protein